MSVLRFMTLLLILLSGSSGHANDWLRFRGPRGAGVADQSRPLPTHWSSSANLAWKTPLPGAGVSSPIVVNGRVFVTCYSGDGLSRKEPGEIKDLIRHLVCVDLQTGKVVWQRDVKAVLPEDAFTGPGVPAHGYASHTPVSDSENVYAFFGKRGVHAFDMDGNRLWQADVGHESDPTKWGSSSSPILHEDTVIVTAAAESQSIVGLDRSTGDEIWRQEASRLDGMWGTPILVDTDGERTDLVMCVVGEVWGLDPDSGRLRWFAEVSGTERMCSSIIPDGTHVYAFTGRGGGSFAVDVGGSGNITETSTLWTGTTRGSFASPVKHQSKLYLIFRRTLTVVDAATGDRLNQVRLKGVIRKRGGSDVEDYSSPIVQDDRLFYVSGSGQVFVFGLGEEPTQLAVNQVTTEAESFGGSPAVSDGCLILRSNKYLYCVADLGEKIDESQVGIIHEESAEPTEDRERRGGSRRRRGVDPMTLFTRRDTNDDGRLTEDELSNGVISQRIAQLDVDGDNVVTTEEFRAGAETLMDRIRNGRRSNDTRPQRPDRPELADPTAGS